MATPRTVFAVLLGLMSCSARAARSKAIVSTEAATQAAGICPEGQEMWVFQHQKGGRDRREHCLPERSALGKKPIPQVRATDQWCCGPLDKLEGKVCQTACLNRSGKGKEDCVPFCEHPDYNISAPAQECPDGQEVYQFMMHKGEAASEEHLHCVPQRENLKTKLDVWQDDLKLDRGCCSGQPEEKICFNACADEKCKQVCEDPLYTRTYEPLEVCPPEHRCYQVNCKTHQEDQLTRHDLKIADRISLCKRSGSRPGTAYCLTICPRNKEARYECRRSESVYDAHRLNVDVLQKDASLCSNVN